MATRAYRLLGPGLVLALAIILSGCAQSSPASPAPAGSKEAAAAVKGGTVAVSPALAQIIEGAKKEGTVSVLLWPGVVSPQFIGRFRSEMKEMFGVDMDIQGVPLSVYEKHAGDLIAEEKARLPYTYDVIASSKSSVSRLIDAGTVEKVGWLPLLIEGTPPQVIRFNGNAISAMNLFIGLTYNPTVIPAAEVPKTIGDLADPKWRGKFAMAGSVAPWVDYGFARGMEKTLADARAIVANKAIIEASNATLVNRYIMGEAPLALLQSQSVEMAQKQGVPVAFQSLEYSSPTEHVVVVTRKAQHPNAAKLVAIYLASPKGRKYVYDSYGGGSLHYLGYMEKEIYDRDMKQGLPLLEYETYPGLADFQISAAAEKARQEFERIFKGG